MSGGWTMRRGSSASCACLSEAVVSQVWKISTAAASKVITVITICRRPVTTIQMPAASANTPKPITR